jgi:hypothetical protein
MRQDSLIERALVLQYVVDKSCRKKIEKWLAGLEANSNVKKGDKSLKK